MSRLFRLALIGVCASTITLLVPAQAAAQRDRRPPPPHRQVVVRGPVFIGGYFYDPFFGPYPWWTHQTYPRWYVPIYDNRAEIKFSVTPKHAAVYVDGFYAGLVDDFDSLFQSLPVPPGGHRIVLYLDGYRTKHHNVFLSTMSTFKLRDTLELLPEGATSEPPPVVAPVPPPPPGSYRVPRTSPFPIPPGPMTPAAEPVTAEGFGTLEVRVLPLDAEVIVDGQRWMSSEPGHYLLYLPAGRHAVEIRKAGRQPFSTELEIRDGVTAPLNVSLSDTR